MQVFILTMVRNAKYGNSYLSVLLPQSDDDLSSQRQEKAEKKSAAATYLLVVRQECYLLNSTCWE